MPCIVRPSFGGKGWFGRPNDGNQQEKDDSQGVKQFVERDLIGLLRDTLVDRHQRRLAAARGLFQCL